MKNICASSIVLGIFLWVVSSSFATANYSMQNISSYSDYEDAYTSFEAGKLDESYIFLKNSLNEHPDHLPSKILMAEVLALSGYYQDALIEFEDVIAMGADINLVIESYVRVLSILGEHKRIINIPENKLTNMKLGFLLSAKATASVYEDKLPLAEEYMQRAYSTAPNNHHVLNTLARYTLNNAEYDKAKQYIDKSLQIDPAVSGTYEILAAFYAYTQNEAARISALIQGLDVNPKNPILMRALVSAYTSKRQYQEAKAALNKILTASPNDPLAQLLYSSVLESLGEKELAKDTLSQLLTSLSLVDSDVLYQQDYALYVSALANFSANNFKLAKAHLEQYLRRNPNNFEMAQLLVEIYERESAFISASKLLEKFSDKISQNPESISKLCNLYIKSSQNYKCDGLLQKNRNQHASSQVFIQTESNLLAARGKLDLALKNLERLPSSSAAVLAQKAVLAIKNNEIAKANELVEQLLSDYPGNNDFLNLQGAILQRKGEFKNAQQIFLKIIENSPEHRSAKYNLAFLYTATNQTNKAIELLDTLLVSTPNDISVMLLKANALIRKEAYELAYNMLSSAAVLDKTNTNIDAMFVDFYMAKDEPENALNYVNKLIKNDLSNTQLLRQRAELNKQLGLEDEVQKDLRMLFGLLSDNAQALFELSDIQGNNADIQGAMESLKRADKLNPENFFISRNMAKLAILMKNKDLAETKVSWLTLHYPNDADVLLLQANLSLLLGNKVKAAEHLHKAIKINNSFAQALVGAYQLAKENIGIKGFLSLFKRLSGDPERNTFAIHLLADYYYGIGNFKESKTAYISISNQLSYRPLPRVLNNLANIYVKEDKIDAAYNFAQQAYELKPSDADILDSLGWITVLRGQYEQGLSLLRQSYSMNTQDPNLRYHLAYTLHKLGRNAESSRELNILLSDFFDFSKKDKALALRETLQNI